MTKGNQSSGNKNKAKGTVKGKEKEIEKEQKKEETDKNQVKASGESDSNSASSVTEIQTALTHLDSLLTLIDSNSNSNASGNSTSTPNKPTNPAGLLQLIPSLLEPISNNHNPSNSNNLLQAQAQKQFLFRNSVTLSNGLLNQLVNSTNPTTSGSESRRPSGLGSGSNNTSTQAQIPQDISRSLKIVSGLLEREGSGKGQDEEVVVKVESGDENEELVNSRVKAFKRKQEMENLLLVRKKRRKMIERNERLRGGGNDEQNEEEGGEGDKEADKGKGQASKHLSQFSITQEDEPYSTFNLLAVAFHSLMESQTQTSTSTLQPTSSSSSSSNPPDYPTSQTLPIFSQFKSYISLLEKELEEKADPKLKSTKRKIRVKISGWSEKESQNQDKSRNKQDDESKQVDEVEGQLEIQVKNLGRCFINFEVSSSSSTTSKSNSNPNESSNSDSSKRQHHALRISRINLLSETEVSSFKPTSLDSIQINKLSNFPIFKELSGNLFKGCLTCPSTRGDHHPLMSLTSTIFQLNSFRFFFESPPPSLLVVMQQLRTAEKVEATLPGKKVEVEGEKVREEDQGKGKEKEIETGDSEMKDGNETQEEEKERNQNGTKNAEVGIKFKPSGPKLWTWRKVLQPKIGDGKIRWVWCSQNQDRNEGGNGSEKLGEVDLTREQEEREDQGEWRAYHSNCTLRM